MKAAGSMVLVGLVYLAIECFPVGAVAIAPALWFLWASS